MANFSGFGTPRTAKRPKQPVEWQGMPQLDLETRIQLWQAGLLRLRLPNGVKARSLTQAEKEWLDRASAAEYLNPEANGQTSISYTAPPPEFRLEAADWYLHPDEYWQDAPIRLQDMMQRFPANLFTLSASGQAPGFYPDRTPDYTQQHEATMRSIFREMVRVGWSLPQYKWWVMRQFRKTTAGVTHNEAMQLLVQLQQIRSHLDAGE
jgi:hypothetical protein